MSHTHGFFSCGRLLTTMCVCVTLLPTTPEDLKTQVTEPAQKLAIFSILCDRRSLTPGLTLLESLVAFMLPFINL
jgi:hypothetical protein